MDIFRVRNDNRIQSELKKVHRINVLFILHGDRLENTFSGFYLLV